MNDTTLHKASGTSKMEMSNKKILESGTQSHGPDNVLYPPLLQSQTTSAARTTHHNEQNQQTPLDLVCELGRIRTDIQALMASHGQLLDELHQVRQIVDRICIPASFVHLLCAKCGVRPIEKMSRDCPRNEGHSFCSDCIGRARGKKRKAICPKCSRHTKFIKICRAPTPHFVD